MQLGTETKQRQNLDKQSVLRKHSGIFRFLNRSKSAKQSNTLKKVHTSSKSLDISDLRSSIEHLHIEDNPGPFKYNPEPKYAETEYPQPLLGILDLDNVIELGDTKGLDPVEELEEATLYELDDIDSFLRMYEDAENEHNTDFEEESILDGLFDGKNDKLIDIEVPPEALDFEYIDDSKADADSSSSFEELISSGRTSTPFEEELSETTAFSTTYEVVTKADIHIYKNYSTKKLLYISNNVLTPQLTNMLHSNTQIT